MSRDCITVLAILSSRQVSMFSARSKSGRQTKRAAWVMEKFGDEIEREMEKEEETG